MRIKYILIVLFSLYLQAMAFELIVIENVSISKKTFIIRKGKLDGILVDQDSIFTTSKFSIVARAIEVTRQFSVWKVPLKHTNVPFEKHQYVTMTNNEDAIWKTVINVENQIEKIQKEQKEIQRLPEDTLQIRGGFSKGLSESSSNVQSGQTTNRTAFQFSITYLKNFFTRFELGVGIRYDQESARNKSPTIIIPTNRFIILGELLYHFSNFKISKKHFYSGLVLGLGRSTTTIGSDQTVGDVTILPEAKIGIFIPFKQRYAFTIETSLEAISMVEKFNDKTAQTTNVMNAKLSAGFRF